MKSLWQDLNTFVRQEGGWLVTQPDINPVRFECQPDSNLPTLLHEAGHRLIELGTHERLMPSAIYEQRGRHRVATTSVSPGVVSVWQLEIIDKPKPEDPRRRQLERLKQIEAGRQAPKPPSDIPKPENQRWKETPPEIKQRVEDQLRAGTRSALIAQMFSVSLRTVSRIKATMDR
jgi:hypothetical protein